MIDMTAHPLGLLGLAIFVGAYLFVIFEEVLDMRKSKPVMLAGGLIWILIALVYNLEGKADVVDSAARHTLLEFSELMLFLMVVITYVNTLEERRIFEVLRARLVAMGLNYRQLFWITGLLAFVLSPVLDNLTTSLVLGAVALAVGAGSPAFVALACINIVVAANAGGAFSPFGDITTLMVWQKGKLAFGDFFAIFVPSALNYLVPAVIMQFSVPKLAPKMHEERPTMKPGTWGVVALFACTIATAVSFKNFLNLPPAMGMMLGLGYLQVFSWILNRRGRKRNDSDMVLDAFQQIARIEWDTLLFFFGIIFAVGGLGVIGYLEFGNTLLYGGLGPTTANIAIGIVSAVLDNIPLMFAVLTMDPPMSEGQWLLLTLTTGVGGSLLSIGSAAGVALMGQARGIYTFFSHLRWTWAVALGYAVSVAAHLVLNASRF